MNRRDFLKYTLASCAATGINPFFRAYAAHGGSHKLLVNVMLLGGADLRYLFAPNPQRDPDYADVFAAARENLYPTATGNNYLAAWQADIPHYLTPVDSTLTFGIHYKADWLLQQFNLGKVAIICNVAASENRRHDHSQLIMHTGDLEASQFIVDRDGWGGRLAEVMGLGNIVSLTNDISVFCNSLDISNRNSKVIHAKDTRNFALSQGEQSTDLNKQRLGRALASYYRAKRLAVANVREGWPYQKFLTHEQQLRNFGDPFAEHLLNVASTRPLALRELYGGDPADKNTPGFDTSKVLNQPYFGRQCANLYDSILGADLLKLRIASMELGGWDTHTGQRDRLAELFSDVFGLDKGLDVVTREINQLPDNPLADTVFVFSTDFGRQLKANGSAGTDHGQGNYMILIGDSVKGGVYGEMFPRAEIADTGNGTRYDQRGADIKGLTSFERILSGVCDWLEPDSGRQVFPNMSKSDLSTFPDGPKLEQSVDLNSLFKST